MAATYRLKGIGWLGACVLVTLGFYLVSLQVAAERKKLEVLDAKIATARRDIRSLETEFDTRANLAQLERWNGDTLALAAPRAAQFVRSPDQLASLDPRSVGEPAGPEVKTAALVVPNAPVFVVPTPIPAAPRPAAPVAMAAAKVVAPRPVAPRSVAVAAARPIAPAPIAHQLARVTFTPGVERAAAMRPVVATRTKPEMALLDRKLLSDSTLDDLLARAAHERGRRK